MIKPKWQESVKAGIPIFVGYMPAAAAFGVLAKGCGLGMWETVLFSALVFAGASQFMALNLLMAGMSAGGIVLATLLVNFRHFLMSAYLSTRLDRPAKKVAPLIAFGVTDEVFSVLSFQGGRLSKTTVFSIQLCAYSAWVAGTLAGYFLGGFLPEILNQSMGVALYALFVAILLPEVKKSRQALFLALGSGALNAALIRLQILPEGWTIIACIVIVALAGSFITETQGAGEEA